ncbi:MAG: VWA domain-containing protein [Deltaproteobacteria bacterium]|nr:MAG: VWA domain-containing protein [Deltaproteobacteria bacterium]
MYTFSSPSRTQLVGQYEAVDTGGGALAWSPDPISAIDAISGGDSSTALFYAVRRAILEDPERDDILVVFSDGKENSSPQGAREDVLNLIEQERIVVFSLGFGNVDQADLRAMSSPYGAFLGVRPSLVGLFSEVAARVQSIYTVVYDTPVSFGSHRLDMRVRISRGRRVRHVATIEAGIDFARQAYGRFPMLPGTVVELTDFTKAPPETLTYTVLPADQAVTGKDSLFAFAIEPSHACPGPDCTIVYQGPYGQGARDEDGRVYFPAEPVVGESWKDPISGEQFTLAGFETLTFFGGTGQKRRYRCAKITFPGGTHWFAPEIGLVRTRDSSGTTLLELASPPCLSDSFSGGCQVR